MKRILYFLTVLSLLTGVSCNLLDQFPHNATSQDNLSEEDIDLLFVGLYCYSQYKPTFNGYFLNDFAGGDFKRGGGSGYDDPAILIADQIQETSGWVSAPWAGYYSWLYQVNSFILSASKLPVSVHRDEMLGVAHFFRGLIYYNLVSRWGTVPILREPYNGPIAASEEEAGWDFVEENLQFAINNAPRFTTKHYVSLQAAKALMARTKLARGRMPAAAALAEEVIGDANFGLADFDRIFRDAANNEEIFTFSNLVDESGINFSSNFYIPATIFVPTSEVANLFTSRDKRTGVSIANQESNIVLNKYDSSNSSTDPIIVIRLAEMYLISAEAQGLEKGLPRLNELRAKRGIGPVDPQTEAEFIDAVLAERRMELLGEGFRWFDLVRLGKLCQTVGVAEKYNRMPIPDRELGLNPLLEQNSHWAK